MTIRPIGTGANELPPYPGAAQLADLRDAGLGLRVVWKPTLRGLVRGDSARGLARLLARVASAGVAIFLIALLPVAAGDDRAERALFAAFDAINAVQWQLAGLRVRAHPDPEAATGPVPADFSSWQSEYHRLDALGELLQCQVEAELDHRELAPHKARARSLKEARTRLRAAPSALLRSRYPLDALSDMDPPVMSWPYGYGRGCATVETTLTAAPRRRPYWVGAGSRLIFGNRRDLRVLEHFDRPRSPTAFLRQHGKSLGVELADLESLISEGSLIAARDFPVSPGATRVVGRTAGYLHFLGTGPAGAESVDPRSLEAIRQADVLWIQDLGLPGLERTSIRDQLGPQKIINTVHYYGTSQGRSVSRSHFYELAARRAIDLATKGRRVTMVFSGSPVIWVDAYTVARQYLQEHSSFDLRVTNAMSFLETVFIPTPLGGVVNLQLRVATLTRPCDISPDIDCIVGQVGDTGQPHGIGTRPESVANALRRLYPADHPVYVVGNDEITSEPLYLESTAGEVIEEIAPFHRWYFCLVIPSLQNARTIRQLGLVERRRQQLAYLLGRPAAGG